MVGRAPKASGAVDGSIDPMGFDAGYAGLEFLHAGLEGFDGSPESVQLIEQMRGHVDRRRGHRGRHRSLGARGDVARSRGCGNHCGSHWRASGQVVVGSRG